MNILSEPTEEKEKQIAIDELKRRLESKSSLSAYAVKFH